jgi:hypothetical protein
VYEIKPDTFYSSKGVRSETPRKYWMYRRPKAVSMTSRCIKDRIGSSVSISIPLNADRGYLGVEAYHANRFIPIKSSKNRHLTKREKAYNKKAYEETGCH